jgi:hypothetical protein
MSTQGTKNAAVTNSEIELCSTGPSDLLNQSTESPFQEIEIATELPAKRNQQRGKIFKIASTYWCFILLGANDSSYGVRSDDVIPDPLY